MKRQAMFFIGTLLQTLFRAVQARWNNQGRWCGAKLFTENHILSTKINFSTNPAHNHSFAPCIACDVYVIDPQEVDTLTIRAASILLVSPILQEPAGEITGRLCYIEAYTATIRIFGRL
jgi:hypothetical protein